METLNYESTCASIGANGRRETEALLEGGKRGSQAAIGQITPEALAKIKKLSLTNGAQALIDAEDYEKCRKYLWHIADKGYASNELLKTRLHNFVFGQPHDGLWVDHRNRNPLDCRKSNLRWATNAQNTQNGRKRRSYAGVKTSSIYKGVTFERHSGKWMAQIIKGGKRKNLGRFKTERDAALAYDCAATMTFGQFASLNFNDPAPVIDWSLIPDDAPAFEVATCPMCGSQFKKKSSRSIHCSGRCTANATFHKYHPNSGFRNARTAHI